VVDFGLTSSSGRLTAGPGGPGHPLGVDFGVNIGSSASTNQSWFSSVLNPFTIIEEIENARHPPLKDILVDLEGVVKPGEILRESYYLPKPGRGMQHSTQDHGQSHLGILLHQRFGALRLYHPHGCR
jgi:hypothetical protein